MRAAPIDQQADVFPAIEEGPDVRTYQPKPADVQRTWHVIDATDVVLGRLASQAAVLLRGKHKAYYAPHLDTGDFVIIVNAEKVALTGTKADKVVYQRHSGYPGGLKTRSFADMRANRPQAIVERAVRGMLPHTRLGRQMASKLKVYAGPTHPHQAQQPVPFEITQVAQ
jgi:large subunit ribosomal protein L13